MISISKFHVLNAVQADVLALSETHLTVAAKRSLSLSLRSRFKHVLRGVPWLPDKVPVKPVPGRGLDLLLLFTATPLPDDLYIPDRQNLPLGLLSRCARVS